MRSIIAFMAGCLSLASCDCWQAEHRSEPRCVIAHQVVDCTTGMASQESSQVLALVMQWIGAGSLNSDTLVSMLEGAGFKEVGCILSALEQDLVSQPTIQRALRDAQLKYLTKKKVHNVTFTKLRGK